MIINKKAIQNKHKNKSTLNISPITNSNSSDKDLLTNILIKFGGILSTLCLNKDKFDTT